jgi:integrase
MTTRRIRGEGSIGKKRADGRYPATIDLGWQDGKRKRKTVYGKTKAEAAEKLREARRNIDLGQAPTDGRLSTAAFLEVWLRDTLPGSVKASTVDNYRDVITHYVVPHVGRVPLVKLAPEDVQAMIRALEAQGLSVRTRRLARAVLRRALGQAEKWGKVPRNVAALVDCPRGADTPADDTLDAAGVRAVLENARGDRLEAFARLALCLGLRRGELLGLRWEDIDFECGEFRIAHSLSYRSGEGLILQEPKTAAGRRTIPLVGQTASSLREHHRRQLEERLVAGPAWVDSGHVFSNELGAPLDPRNVLRWWHRLTERSGVGRRRIHAARHTAATMLLEEGVPLEVVSAVLGHASLTITSDIYARVRMDAKRKGLSALATAIDVG